MRENVTSRTSLLAWRRAAGDSSRPVLLLRWGARCRGPSEAVPLSAYSTKADVSLLPGSPSGSWSKCWWRVHQETGCSVSPLLNPSGPLCSSSISFFSFLNIFLCLLVFSRQVVTNSFQHHRPQRARLSLSFIISRVCSNSCPLSR